MGEFGFQEVEEFIFGNDIDFDAAEALRAADPVVQEKVCNVGPIRGKNPSAVLMERLRAASHGHGDGDGPPGSPERFGSASPPRRNAPPNPGFERAGGSNEVEDFIVRNGIDDRAAEDFRRCPPDVQSIVMDNGDFRSARNPSAALLSRIKSARSGASTPGPSQAKGSVAGALGSRGRERGEDSYARRGSFGAPTEQDITDFVAANGIDERAEKDLRGCSGELIAKVLETGDLSTARNPSAALLARIRTCRKELESSQGSGGGHSDWGDRGDRRDRGGGDGGGGGSHSSWGGSNWKNDDRRGSSAGISQADVDSFIRANGIDDRAAGDLRNCSAELQAKVLEKGDLSTARNPSGALVALIKNCRKEVESSSSRGGGAADWGGNDRSSWGGSNYGVDRHRDSAFQLRHGNVGPSEREISRFIEDNRIDDRAANDLRSCAPEVQAKVLADGNLATARNPSAALNARIRDSRREIDAQASSGGGGGGRSGWDGATSSRDDRTYGRRDDRGYGGRDDRRDGGRDDRRDDRWDGGRDDRKDGGRGYSGRDDRGHSGRDERGGKEPSEDEINDFIILNDLDERAAGDLQSCPPEVQAKVLARGIPREVRNPNAFLYTRIKEARQDVEREGGGGGGRDEKKWSARDQDSGGWGKADQAGPSEKEIEAYLSDNGIDDRGAQIFRECPPEVQTRVLARGDLQTARNPSSMLLVRIKESRQDVERGDQGHNARGGGEDRSRWGGREDSAWSSHGKAGPSEHEIARFIDENRIDDRAANDFRSCAPELQAKVMEKGDLSTARNPSAALLARIRDSRRELDVPASSGGGGGGRAGWDSANSSWNDRSRSTPIGAPAIGAPRGSRKEEPRPSKAGTRRSDAGARSRSRSPARPAKALASHPVLHLAVPSDCEITQQGMPPEGLAVVHDDATPEMLTSGHNVLEDLVGDSSTVTFEDEPEIYPEMNEALSVAGCESMPFCVALSPDCTKWAVGVGASEAARRSAAELALSLTLAPASEDLDSLLSSHPDFGRLCEAFDAAPPPAKRLKGGH